MEKIKPPSVAGTFYSENADKLKQDISFFQKDEDKIISSYSRAVIVPHAGLIYSGNLAYMGLSALKKELKTLLIFAPAHKMYFEGISLSGFDFWQTPLGNVEIDKKINEELKEFGFINDEAFIQEHSVEIQLPLIQTIFDNVKIVPILIGKADCKTVSKIIEKYYDNEDLGFIISSDLSHFLTYDEAKRVDNLTSSLIENLDIENFKPEFACNSIGIKGLIDFAKTKNWPLIVSGLYNSGDVTGETNRVVGYGAWALYEGNLNSFIKKYYSNFILSLCKLSIKSAYEPIKEKIEVPLIMKQKGASFVTLEKNGQLRGCIGSIGAYRPLIEDIISNAQNAAFKDPRFYPVQKEEIEELQIAVSLLSNPVPIDFKDEEDLLNQLIKDVDGLIIKDKEKSAVYLPSVWEQLQDKKDFLNNLKIKAGFTPDYFSDTFEAYRFRVEYIK